MSSRRARSVSPSSRAPARNSGSVDDVEDRERGGARERVPAERASEPSGRDGVHDLGAARDACEREAAADRLPEDRQVRLGARVLLDRPHRPGPPDSGLHLVTHPQDPVLAAELVQTRRIVRRQREEPALALHRLDDHAGDRRGIDVGLEEVLERFDRVVRRDPAIRIRGGCAVDLGRERAETCLVRLHLARHRHREQRAAVEGVVEGDHRRSTRRPARDLHCVLDRLGSRVDEDRALLAATARRELGQAPADLDVRLVRADHEALVEIAIGLLLDRVDDRRLAMARVLAADPAGEVDERPAVRIRDPRPFGVRDDELRRRHPGRDVACAIREDALRRCRVSRHRRIICPQG